MPGEVLHRGAPALARNPRPPQPPLTPVPAGAAPPRRPRTAHRAPRSAPGPPLPGGGAWVRVPARRRGRRAGRAAACSSPGRFLPGCGAQVPRAMGAAAGGDAQEGAAAAAPLEPGRGLPLPRGSGGPAASQDKLFLIKGAESRRPPPTLLSSSSLLLPSRPLPARVGDRRQRVPEPRGRSWTCRLPRPAVPQGRRGRWPTPEGKAFPCPLRRSPRAVPISVPGEEPRRLGTALAAALGCSEEAPTTPLAFSRPFRGGGARRPAAPSPRLAGRTRGRGTALPGGLRAARGGWARSGTGPAVAEGSRLPPWPRSRGPGAAAGQRS